MKVLYVTHGLPPDALGGVELHSLHLARALGSRHQVHVLCPADDPALPAHGYARASLNGVSVIRAQSARGGRRFEDLHWNPRSDEMFERVLDDVAPDLVHAQSLIRSSFGVLEVAQRRKVPTVATLNDYFSVCPLGQRIRRDLDLCVEIDRARCARCLRPPFAAALSGPAWSWPSAVVRTLGHRLLKAPSDAQLANHDRRMREVLARTDRLVTPSAFHRSQFVAYGVPADRIRVIPPGIDRGPLVDTLRPRQPSEGLRIGYIGSVIPSKGVHVLLEAFLGVEAPAATLSVHGQVLNAHGEHGYGRGLEARARLDPRVSLHGHYDHAELPSILRSLDVLVVPSLWFESYCMTVREGFAAGLVVVASKLGALEEAIEDGVTGLLFEVGDPADLRSKLECLIEDRALRERLAASPKRVVDIEENAAMTEALYAELVRT